MKLEIYRHKTGELYIKIMECLEIGTLEKLVICQGIKNKKVYAIPLEKFNEEYIKGKM